LSPVAQRDKMAAQVQGVDMDIRKSGRLAVAAAALAAMAMLGGCASGPSVRATSDPAADFATFRTYGFVERTGTDRGDYATIVSRALKAAVAVEMEKRGYRPSDNPDLLVNFQANVRRKQEMSAIPSAVAPFRGGYYGIEGPFYGYGCLETARDVNEGSLNIDIVDRVRKQSVWEGVALGEVSEAKLRQPEVTLPPLVAQIFAHYPYAAGRGTTATPQP
jgi:hypothetical protein